MRNRLPVKETIPEIAKKIRHMVSAYKQETKALSRKARRIEALKFHLYREKMKETFGKMKKGV